MADYEPIKLRAFYRSPSHLHIWEILDKAGIWQEVGVDSVELEYCLQPAEAEAALFDGSIDFVSGNHITPYGLVARGKPIVSWPLPVTM